MERVGWYGVIAVEASGTAGLELAYVESARFDQGYASPYFGTDPERRESVREAPYVLVYQGRINAVRNLLPLLEQVVATGRPLAIFARDVEGEALATLVVNNLRGVLGSVTVEPPEASDGYDDVLTDIAILTGGRVLGEDRPLQNATLDDLGQAARIVVDEHTTTIFGGTGWAERIAVRVAQLRAELRRSNEEREWGRLLDRLTRLTAGTATIRVGAPTEVELAERRDQVEAAVRSARAAVEEGVVAGGGVALVQAGLALDELELVGDEARGVDVVRAALEAPLRQIAVNAGLEGGVVAETVKALRANYGLDATSGEYVDMIGAGILDPVKVSRLALENAAATAGTLLGIKSLDAEAARHRRDRCRRIGVHRGRELTSWASCSSRSRPDARSSACSSPGSCRPRRPSSSTSWSGTSRCSGCPSSSRCGNGWRTSASAGSGWRSAARR